jgi:hypothetical protein
MNFKTKWYFAGEGQPVPGTNRGKVEYISVDKIVTDDFRAGQCACGVHVQGGRAIWADHRKVIHGDDGRTDIGMTPYW